MFFCYGEILWRSHISFRLKRLKAGLTMMEGDGSWGWWKGGEWWGIQGRRTEGFVSLSEVWSWFEKLEKVFWTVRSLMLSPHQLSEPFEAFTSHSDAQFASSFWFRLLANWSIRMICESIRMNSRSFRMICGSFKRFWESIGRKPKFSSRSTMIEHSKFPGIFSFKLASRSSFKSSSFLPSNLL
jgi:hypothetical protein